VGPRRNGGVCYDIDHTDIVDCEDKDVFMSRYVTSAFRKLLVAYFVVGSITIILALVILFLMVSK
jgi:hypothetical protein